MSERFLPLAWSRAYGGVAGSADFKSTPADFRVDEQLPFAPKGEGEHLFLQIEKTGQNTVWLARQLAKMADIPAADVSYAGLKDRHGVTLQWFSLRQPGLAPDGEHDTWAERVSQLEGVRLVSSARHDRKLRTGALTGNHFVIRLRNFEGDRARLEQLLQCVSDNGFPNYFGEQRFGHQGYNLGMAEKLFAGSIRLARDKRSFALSAARSFLFNHLLNERVTYGSWNQMDAGDVLTFPQSASLIYPEKRDDTVAERFQGGELLSTGPMWGQGSLPTQGVVAELEQAVADKWPDLAHGLEAKGLKQERRALKMPVKDLHWSWDSDDIELSFFLYKGSYATAVLHELVSYQDKT